MHDQFLILKAIINWYNSQVQKELWFPLWYLFIYGGEGTLVCYPIINSVALIRKKAGNEIHGDRNRFTLKTPEVAHFLTS